MNIKEVVGTLGVSYSELARKLGVTRSAVLQWGDKIPLGRQYQIRDLLEGKNPIGATDEPFHTPESVSQGEDE